MKRFWCFCLFFSCFFFAERQYRGPLNISEEDNPFHTRGAAEYISQSQYEAQSNDMTQKALADLAQYVSNANLFDALNHLFVY
jgi:hypothetical protein